MDDYRAESELGSLARDLLADLERLRPGLPDTGSADELLEALRPRAAVRLEELYRDHFAAAEEALSGGDAKADTDTGRLALYRREIDQLLLPRYAVLAQRQNRSERAPATPMRGADLFNRAAYALIFLLIGLFVVWAPFIPIWDKWIPFVLGGLAATFAPALPDLHRRLLLRRHQIQVLTLVIDLDQAGQALPESSAVAPGLLPAASSQPKKGDMP